ncbi:MAG: helix-turn-helix domain-containing protein [Bacteroides sp.]|nr:helix-turn-helix domain-containing protein [Bacteroides sp.]
MLRSELTNSQNKELITKLIELILTYCMSFFSRQYSQYGNEAKGHHIVSRLEYLLDDYYATNEQHSKGLPTVRFCADCLCLAPNYLGDLIRQETGDSANHFIGRYIIRHAKDLLMSGKSVTETAYMLGFDFPSHLSRLFNRLEGITPTVYVKQITKKKDISSTSPS